LLLFALLLACAADRPLVERFEQGNWQPVPFRIASMGGQRAGTTVTFVLRLERAEGHRLTVEGTVEIDPLSEGSSERSSPSCGVIRHSMPFFKPALPLLSQPAKHGAGTLS
jgi:hypothetical protein